jgi:hypothetical protein
LLGRQEEAGEWLSAQPAVHDLRIAGQQVIFGFKGSDEAQADLMDGLIRLGIRMRAFEEKRSSFEDILVEVAEPTAAHDRHPPIRHSAWNFWKNPIFRRYCQARLRFQGLGAALLSRS